MIKIAFRYDEASCSTPITPFHFWPVRVSIRAMRKLPILALVALFAATACTNNPVGLNDELELGHEIVITKGAKAPARQTDDSDIRPLSDLGAETLLIGSSTTPVSLKPTTCPTYEAASVTVTYVVTGRQGNPASFKVNTRWTYDGTDFVGSAPTTINVPARSPGDAATNFPVDLTIENNAAGGSGSTSFTIVPFDLVTSSPGALEIDEGDVTVHVAFTACPVTNTAPWLNVPGDYTVAAENATGVIVNYSAQVTYGDAEDDIENLNLVCIPASGTRFPLGATEVTCRVTDTGGLYAEDSFTVTVADQTPPTIDVPAILPTMTATSLDGWALDLSALGITVSDNVSSATGIDVNCGPTILPIGMGEFGTSVSCTATDEAGNTTPVPATFTVNVTLPGNALNGGVLSFGSPLRMSPTFSAHKRGSTIPHKIGRPSVGGEEMVIDPSDLRLVLIALENGGTVGSDIEAVPTAASTTWRWDDSDQQYIFNLATSALTAGTDYRTTVSYRGIILARTTFGVRR
jgi:hypothetical protein